MAIIVETESSELYLLEIQSSTVSSGRFTALNGRILSKGFFQIESLKGLLLSVSIQKLPGKIIHVSDQDFTAPASEDAVLAQRLVIKKAYIEA